MKLNCCNKLIIICSEMFMAQWRYFIHGLEHIVYEMTTVLFLDTQKKGNLLKNFLTL